MPKVGPKLKRTSGFYQAITLFFLTMFVLAIVVQGYGAFQPTGTTNDRVIFIVDRSPVLLFAFAIFQLYLAMRRVGRGEPFDEYLPRLFRRAGIAFALGAFIITAGFPIAAKIISHHGAVFQFDPSAIVVGVVGICLTLIARLMRLSAKISAELDEFV